MLCVSKCCLKKKCVINIKKITFNESLNSKWTYISRRRKFSFTKTKKRLFIYGILSSFFFMFVVGHM